MPWGGHACEPVASAPDPWNKPPQVWGPRQTMGLGPGWRKGACFPLGAGDSVFIGTEKSRLPLLSSQLLLQGPSQAEPRLNPLDVSGVQRGLLTHGPARARRGRGRAPGTYLCRGRWESGSAGSPWHSGCR